MKDKTTHELKGAPLDTGHFTAGCGYCGGPIPPSRSKNKKEKRLYCCKLHKNLAGIVARTVGRRVIILAPGEKEREELLSSIEKIGPGRIAVIGKGLREVRKNRQEYVDLGGMAKQERLGALCRCAERWGVMPNDKV